MPSGPARILVIGGGLIGADAALRLRRTGGQVRVLSRSMSPRLVEIAREEGVDLIESEVGAGRSLATAVEDADAILCLAGSSTPAIAAADPEGALSGSLFPVLTTLEAARDAGVRRVVIASSGGTVYGPAAPLPTPEEAPLRPSSLHGVNYLAVEAFADYFRRECSMEIVVLRFSNVYGPGATPRRGQGVIAAWTRALALGRSPVLIGPDSARRDFLFSADAAEAIAAVLEGPSGTYNVGAGVSTSLAELIEHLRAVTGKDFQVDARPGRGVDVPATHLDIGLIERVTGWRPATGIIDGLRAVWEWESRGLEASASAATSE
jgi:UDP-glucose 4-epimerase